MKTKLTVTIETEVLSQAKVFAKANGKSLSSLIESFLTSLIEQEEAVKENIPLTTLVKSLRGALQVENPVAFDYKATIEEELEDQYLE